MIEIKTLLILLKKWIPENKKLIDDISYIEIDYEGYLLSTPIENNLYLIDYIDEKYLKKIGKTDHSKFHKIILMEKEDESIIPDYLNFYIFCKD